MKQAEDTFTLDILTPRRGRPSTGNALSAAERMRRYRAARAAGVGIDRDAAILALADIINSAAVRQLDLYEVFHDILEAVDVDDKTKVDRLLMLARSIQSKDSQ